MQIGDGLVKIVRIFETNIKRSVAPSLVLFVLLAVADLAVGRFALGMPVLDRVQAWIAAVPVESPWLVGLVAFLGLVGTGYILSALNHMIFDDWLKEDFDAEWYQWQSENRLLGDLRQAVVKRINDEAKQARDKDFNEANLARLGELDLYNDFALYEILGGIDPTPTVAYVDRAKSIGITAVSLALTQAGVAVHLVWVEGDLRWLALLVLLGPIWFLGREGVKAQYRSRAVRLYVNFLMMPSERLRPLLCHHFTHPEERKKADAP